MKQIQLAGFLFSLLLSGCHQADFSSEAQNQNGAPASTIGAGTNRHGLSNIKNVISETSSPKPLTAAEKRAVRKRWEATPGGMAFKKWEHSFEGKRVLAGAAKISGHIKGFTNMEAVVTSLSLPPGSRLGFGVMARIKGDEYILRFDDEVQQLNSLKVNDEITVKSRSVSYAPKYAYPIVSGEYVERGGKVMYTHAPRKGGC